MNFTLFLEKIDIEKIVIVVTIESAKYNQTASNEPPSMSPSCSWLVICQKFCHNPR